MKTHPTLREQTLAEVTARPNPAALPAFIRMPQPGCACPITGLRRGALYALYALAVQGKIKTSTIRKKGSLRGIRLVSVSSLISYVESCVDTPETTEETDSQA